MAIKQYPYLLKVLHEEEAVFDQDTAQWIEGQKEWKEFGKCRDEINGSGANITLQDGQKYIFSAVIYSPKNIPEIKKGSKVQVWDGNSLRLEGDVVRFSKEQLHTRIWL